MNATLTLIPTWVSPHVQADPVPSVHNYVVSNTHNYVGCNIHNYVVPNDYNHVVSIAHNYAVSNVHYYVLLDSHDCVKYAEQWKIGSKNAISTCYSVLYTSLRSYIICLAFPHTFCAMVYGF